VPVTMMTIAATTQNGDIVTAAFPANQMNASDGFLERRVRYSGQFRVRKLKHINREVQAAMDALVAGTRSWIVPFSAFEIP
jgi:hypothetical protein